MEKKSKKENDVYIFGSMNHPKYYIDFHRSRICSMLTKDFKFHSLDDYIIPRYSSLFHSKPWMVSLHLYRAFTLRNPKIHHIVTFYGTPLNKKIAKKCVKSADVVTTVSLTTMNESLHEFGDADYRVIYDAVDTDFYKPTGMNNTSSKMKVLMVITGIRHLKNVQVFIEMAKSLPNIDFILRTFSKIDSPLLPDNLTVDNTKYPSSNYGDAIGLRDLYNSADVYLYPSVHEGLNNTMLDAMACGLPMVAFDVTSMSELIEHEKNGFLCHSFLDMEQSLMYLSENREECKKMGKRSREIAKWFTWGRCAEGYRRIYEEFS